MRGRLLLGVILGCLLGACVESGWANPLRYRFKVGSTYLYQMSVKAEAEMSGFEDRQKEPLTEEATATIRVLEFQNGVYLLDLALGRHQVRRFMREDGSIVLRPGEEGERLPFFLTLPREKLVSGQPVQVPGRVEGGGRSLPAAWELKIEKEDAAKGLTAVALAGKVPLPSDQQRKRQMTIAGGLVYDAKAGVFTRGEVTVTYALTFLNKEIAVIRPQWDYRETRTTSFRLVKVTP